ncbi:hypothetical protein L484_019478 [Morus notabilis]|uniref:Uncharacterized protein n=1 Tax=Morus notabilis TaxID=981085 RepID=W9SCZ7_9ROSA|nr:hypothetical protein L484_019478 [Morus notabilis]
MPPEKTLIHEVTTSSRYLCPLATEMDDSDARNCRAFTQLSGLEKKSLPPDKIERGERE